jgi:OmpA-OmpF porin, OOP family
MASDSNGGGRWMQASAGGTITTRRVEAYRKRRLWPLLFVPGVLVPGLIETNSRIEDDLTEKAQAALGDRLQSVDFSAQDARLCFDGDFAEGYDALKDVKGVAIVRRGDDCAPTDDGPAAQPASTTVPATDAAPATTDAAATTAAPSTTAAPTTTVAEAGSALDARATFDGASIVLSGTVDNETQRQTLVDGAVAAVGGDQSKVTDQLTVAGSESNDVVATADGTAVSMGALIATMPPNLANGVVAYEGRLYITGEYLDDNAKAAVEDDAAEAGVEADNVSIEPRPVATASERDQLLADVNALFVTTSIQFEPASASILDESLPVLDDAAAQLKQFDLTGVVIDVEGHTDADGSEASNLALSQQRAEAVAAALVERGVDSAALNPVGYGETRPIAENDTPENKARNRRVQFTAQQ